MGTDGYSGVSLIWFVWVRIRVGNNVVSLSCSINVSSKHHYFIGCCRFFGLFGRVLKVVLPNVSPVSVAGIFRGQHSVLWCSLLGNGVFMAVR